jgi:DivIVA domain-containing protein
VTPQELAHEIEHARFTPVRFSEGYDMREVDDLLERLVQGLRNGLDVRAEAARARFTPVRFREAYRMADVDGLLRRIGRVQPEGIAAAEEAPAAVPAEARRSEVVPPAPGDAGHPTHQVQRSFLDRLRDRRASS